MSTALWLFSLLAFGMTSGFVWAKLTLRVRAPELLKMLTAPIWSAALGLIPAAIYFLGFVRTEQHLVDLRRAMLGTATLFVAFVPLALFPSLLGWTLGERTRGSAGNRWS